MAEYDPKRASELLAIVIKATPGPWCWNGYALVGASSVVFYMKDDGSLETQNDCDLGAIATLPDLADQLRAAMAGMDVIAEKQLELALKHLNLMSDFLKMQAERNEARAEIERLQFEKTAYQSGFRAVFGQSVDALVGDAQDGDE